MKLLSMIVYCDVAGCDRDQVAEGKAKGTMTAALMAEGWRFGAARDVCPSCREKGHRP